MVQLGRQWIEDQTRHEHMTNHDNNNVHYGSLWILPEKIPPSKKKRSEGGSIGISHVTSAELQPLALRRE
jgi:hypothetical protein